MMTKNAVKFLLLALSLSLISLKAQAQDSIDESLPESRSSILAELDQDHRVACGAKRLLGLCGVSKRSSKQSYRAEPARNDRHYNKLQRLAGAIADRMEAGKLGNVKIKLKIILE